jgi:hypothetical protein
VVFDRTGDPKPRQRLSRPIELSASKNNPVKKQLKSTERNEEEEEKKE